MAYTFRVRATDNVSNTSAWVQAEVKTVVVKKYYSVAGQRVAMRSNGVLYYLHSDHLSSASLVTFHASRFTSHVSRLIAQQRYYPYGEVRWQSGALPTDRQFTGQRREAALGIYDYKARFYSPRLGRFLSADTLVPGVGSLALNRYMYVEGNPIRLVDPTGYFTEEEINQHLKNTYGGYWELYRDAWMADYFFWRLLLVATYQDVLFAPGSGLGAGVFTRNGDTFSFVCSSCGGGSVNHTPQKNLADYQSQAELNLVDSDNNSKYSIGTETFEMGSVTNIFAKLMIGELAPARRPIYDYSGGYPASTGKSWVMTFEQRWQLDLMAGDGVPWLIGGQLGSKVLEKVVWVSRVVSAASIVTFVNEAVRTTWKFGWAESNTPYNDWWQHSWGIKPYHPSTPSPFD